jgi:hypothetical protein
VHRRRRRFSDRVWGEKDVISSVPRLGRGVSPEPPIVAKLLEPVRDIRGGCISSMSMASEVRLSVLHTGRKLRAAPRPAAW